MTTQSVETLRTEVDNLPHDDFTRMLTEKVISGIAQVNEANDVLLEQEGGVNLREIDSELKKYQAEVDSEGKQTNKEALAELDQDLVKQVAKMVRAREAFKKAQSEARNLYRTNVLNEEAQEETEIDEDAVRQTRKMVQEGVNLLVSYAKSNGKTDFVRWAEQLEIPQVGRKGSSTVGGKKPRAYVSVDDTITNSFGEAAKKVAELVNAGKDKKDHVSYTSGDLIKAWSEAGESETFSFEGHTITVKEKPKKSEQG